MLRKTSKGFYTLTTLSNFKNLVHGFSTKGFGDVRFKIAGTKKNRDKLAKVLNIESEFIGLAQKHGNKVMMADERDLGKIIAGADGLVTNKPGVNLMIRVADCLPILVYDPKNRVVGSRWVERNGGRSSKEFNKKICKRFQIRSRETIGRFWSLYRILSLQCY